MAVYLYAVTEGVPALEGVEGLHGSPVRAVRESPLAAIVSEVAGEISALTEEDLWSHEAAVEAVMDRHPVLPMRLGAVAADDAEVRELLRARRTHFQQGLERVRGAVELGVRALLADDGGDAPRSRPESGSEYLLGRLEEEREREALAGRIHAPLAAIAREAKLTDKGNGAPWLRFSYLVDLDRVESFRSRVDQLRAEQVAPTLVCTGPWPPYSFAGERAAP